MIEQCDYTNEIVCRNAPRWAWEYIDGLLASGARRALDGDMCVAVATAVVVSTACTDYTHLSEIEVRDEHCQGKI